MQMRNLIMQCGTRLQTKMLDKLKSSERWSYVSVPDGMDAAVMSEKMHYFINHKIDEFIGLCADVLPDFTQKDSESIGTEQLTAGARKFVSLFVYLEQQGFPGPGMFKQRIYFWSGDEAKKNAPRSTIELADDRIPSVSVMFDLGQTIFEILGKYDSNLCLLFSAISRVYASHAHGVVNVYVSSDKSAESAGFTVTNNFWEAELATLQRLKARQIVEDIHIHLYDQKKQRWNKPASLYSEEGRAIAIRRRCFHQTLDKPFHLARFRSGKSEKELWSQTKPRPAISFGAMQTFARRWRAYANCRLFARRVNDGQIKLIEQAKKVVPPQQQK